MRRCVQTFDWYCIYVFHASCVEVLFSNFHTTLAIQGSDHELCGRLKSPSPKYPRVEVIHMGVFPCVSMEVLFVNFHTTGDLRLRSQVVWTFESPSQSVPAPVPEWCPSLACSVSSLVLCQHFIISPMHKQSLHNPSITRHKAFALLCF